MSRTPDVPEPSVSSLTICPEGVVAQVVAVGDLVSQPETTQLPAVLTEIDGVFAVVVDT
jgi:hypothetical protein